MLGYQSCLVSIGWNLAVASPFIQDLCSPFLHSLYYPDILNDANFSPLR